MAVAASALLLIAVASLYLAVVGAVGTEGFDDSFEAVYVWIPFGVGGLLLAALTSVAVVRRRVPLLAVGAGVAICLLSYYAVLLSDHH